MMPCAKHVLAHPCSEGWWLHNSGRKHSKLQCLAWNLHRSVSCRRGRVLTFRVSLEGSMCCGKGPEACPCSRLHSHNYSRIIIRELTGTVLVRYERRISKDMP